ncbi:hypothetical protein JCGZ_17083 [Jatropha curcas]|uniref:Uncharacterized protein n=1 Tax=Jatropha curcas TaxID=180498 RepID=A0A067LLA4_JATCU|nr:hypothetical protein JCGZ_17083 [Jatropha curcas]
MRKKRCEGLVLQDEDEENQTISPLSPRPSSVPSIPPTSSTHTANPVTSAYVLPDQSTGDVALEENIEINVVVDSATEEEQLLSRMGKKRARVDSDAEPICPNIEAFFKSIYGPSTSYSKSSVSKELTGLTLLKQDFKYFDHMEESAISMACITIFLLEMLHKGCSTHNQEICDLNERLNFATEEYRRVSKQALVTNDKNVQLEKENSELLKNKAELEQDATNYLIETIEIFQDEMIAALKARLPNKDFDFIFDVPLVVEEKEGEAPVKDRPNLTSEQILAQDK